jgi:hypothetical protein
MPPKLTVLPPLPPGTRESIEDARQATREANAAAREAAKEAAAAAREAAREAKQNKHPEQ